MQRLFFSKVTQSAAGFNPQCGLCPCEECAERTFFTGLQVSTNGRHADKTANLAKSLLFARQASGAMPP